MLAIDRHHQEADAVLPIALLATPVAAVGIAGTALSDAGLQVFAGVSTVVLLGALTLLYKAIVRGIRSTLAEIVTTEVRKLVDEQDRQARRIDNLERHLDP